MGSVPPHDGAAQWCSGGLVLGSSSPVAGLVTWQSPCTLLRTGQAAAVGQEKVYSQSSTALINMGLEFYEKRQSCDRCMSEVYNNGPSVRRGPWRAHQEHRRLLS